MLVLYPYTERRPEALAALAGTVAAVDVSSSDDAYWRLLARHWRAGRAFAVVEHDVVVPAGLMAGMDACDRWWCTAPVPRHHVGAPLVSSLGCARFSTGLLAAEPDLMDTAGRFSVGMPPKHWVHLDIAIADTLGRRGYEPHVHPGDIIHLPKTTGA